MSKFQIIQSQFLTTVWLYLCISSRNLDNINLTNYITVVEDNGSHFLRFLLTDVLDTHENWSRLFTSPHCTRISGKMFSQSYHLCSLASRGRISPGPSAHGNTGCNSRMRHRTCELRNTGTKLENSHFKIPTHTNFKQCFILALYAIFLFLPSLVIKHENNQRFCKVLWKHDKWKCHAKSLHSSVTQSKSRLQMMTARPQEWGLVSQ